MNKIICFIALTIILAGLISPVFGQINISGSESAIIMNLERCNQLNVSVTAELRIDEGEYSFVNCTQENTDFWRCLCYDDYNLIMETDARTINSYEINISYFYIDGEDNEPVYISGSASSSGSKKKKNVVQEEEECDENWICYGWNKCSEHGMQARRCTDANACGTTEDKPLETRECEFGESSVEIIKETLDNGELFLNKGQDADTNSNEGKKGLAGITGKYLSNLSELEPSTIMTLLVILLIFGLSVGLLYFMKIKK